MADAPTPTTPELSDEPRAATDPPSNDSDGAAPRPPVHSMPPVAPSERVGFLERVGVASAMGVAGAIVCSIPTALRASGEGGGFVSTVWVGTAVVLPLAAVLIGLLRSSGRGFRAVARIGVGSAPAGSEASARRTAALAIALWIGLSVPLLAGLGAGLKAATNHRGLGGATFGVVGLGLVLVAALVAQRLTRMGRALIDQGRPPWLVVGGLGALALIPTSMVVAPVLRSSQSSGAVLAALVDGAALAVAVALLVSVAIPKKVGRVARYGGLPLAVLVLLTGVRGVEGDDAQAMRRGGGLAASLLGALERWSDQDQDGHGAHFGGGDCDEGDPRRHPGAPDTEGDGLDLDCDGTDAPAPVAPGQTVLASMEVPQSSPRLESPSASASPKASASAPPAPTAESAPASDRPHIVLVTLDTVRADRTSAYGYDKATTPVLARLAERAHLFEHAYATASDTQRALCPLVSGRRLSQTERGGGEWPRIEPEVETLAERLQKAGYATGAVSTFTWLRKDKGFTQGFDRFEEAFQHAHPEREATGKHAVAAAKSILADFEKQDRPSFLWVHLFDAHERYLEHPGIDFGTSKSGRYDGEIHYVDQRLGELLAAVAESGRGESTAWLVHGSHGEGMAEHQYWGHGRELYEETIRVPLVLAMPGQSEGSRFSDSAVSTGDIAKTVLSLAKAPAEGVHGTSLLGLMAEGAERRAPVYVRAPSRAVLIDWPLKLMRKVRGEKKKDRFLLFDLEADPGEKRDLSEDRKDDLERLQRLLVAREDSAASK